MKIPTESSLRKHIVDKIYKTEFEQLQHLIKSKYLWTSIDETTDVEGRYVANIILGILSEDKELSEKRFLVNCVNLEKVNHETIARAYNSSIEILGKDFDKNRILLLLTDAAPYIIKAARNLKIFYPKLLHVTCLAHGLHRVAEEIRSNYENVDILISCGKKIFAKASSRVILFKEKLPHVPLPPQPVITRWGTWLVAVKYYSKYFEEIKSIVNEFNDEDAAAIKTIKKILNQIP